MYRITRARKFRRTTLLSLCFVATLAGLFVSQYGVDIPRLWLIVLPGLLLIGWRREYAALAAVVGAGMLIGLVRGHSMYKSVAHYAPLYDQTSNFAGTVADDPGYDEARDQTAFNLQNVTHEGNKLPGRIQIKSRGQSKNLSRGDVIGVRGKLRASLGVSRQGSMLATELTILEEHPSIIEKLRIRFFRSVERALPEPQASIGLGYLVGARVNIPKEVSDQLALVGLTHIVAVSGYNLTIIIQAVRRFIGKRSAYQSLVFSLLFVGGFVVIAGGSPPINRAAVVSIFSLLAWYYGREFKPVLLLLLSGVVTGLFNPLYVWGDPSWYLSFLAFTGILVVAPLMQKLFFRSRSPGILMGILLETLAAQVLTTPYSLYLFGGVSIIAPLANVLVLPFVPFIMLAVFVVGVLGMINSWFAYAIAFVPSSLISLQLWIIERLSDVSWAHTEWQIGVFTMIVLFALLGLVYALLSVITKHNKVNVSKINLV